MELTPQTKRALTLEKKRRKEKLKKVPPFSTLVRRLREKNGLTLDELSSRVKKSAASVHFIEAKRIPAPTVGFFLRMRKELRIPADVFVAALEKEFTDADLRSRSGSGRKRSKPTRKKTAKKSKVAKKKVARRSSSSKSDTTKRTKATSKKKKGSRRVKSRSGSGS
jgi:hypothetical protein